MVLERMPRLLLMREFSRMLLVPEASLRILRRSAASAAAPSSSHRRRRQSAAAESPTHATAAAPSSRTIATVAVVPCHCAASDNVASPRTSASTVSSAPVASSSAELLEAAQFCAK
jgi:hypothetical protein